MECTHYLSCKVCQNRYLKFTIVDGKRKWAHKKFCPECHRENSGIVRHSVSDEDFKKSIASSFSVAQALEKMGICPAGGNYATFHKRVKNLNVDTSHFVGMIHMKGKKIGVKRKIEDYFNNLFPISSHALSKRLLSEGIKHHKCENCRQETWLNQKIPLELHHVNGNSSDNSLLNLQFLCPNCHALTENYRGKNQKRRKLVSPEGVEPSRLSAADFLQTTNYLAESLPV